MPIHAHFFRQAIFTRKVSQTDLVFVVPSEFINRSAHTGLQVSVRIGYDFWHPDYTAYTRTKTAFWPTCMKTSASWAKMEQQQ